MDRELTEREYIEAIFLQYFSANALKIGKEKEEIIRLATLIEKTPSNKFDEEISALIKKIGSYAASMVGALEVYGILKPESLNDLKEETKAIMLSLAKKHKTVRVKKEDK